MGNIVSMVKVGLGTKTKLACVACVGCQSEHPLRLRWYHSSTSSMFVVENRDVVLILVVKSVLIDVV